uniref:Uncharacterized protein n=1 Tax=Glossina brevipalpis TaxID=37001 RepID=A0A1A9WPZ4_9MUSC
MRPYVEERTSICQTTREMNKNAQLSLQRDTYVIRVKATAAVYSATMLENLGADVIEFILNRNCILTCSIK